MNIPVEKPTRINDGLHQGVIIAVNYRTTPYKYTDYVIEFLQDTEKYQLKCGFPTKLYEESKHGNMLKRFGITVAEGLECDPDSLIGRLVSFQTITKGKFSEIVQESLKPLQEHMCPATGATASALADPKEREDAMRKEAVHQQAEEELLREQAGIEPKNPAT